MEKGRENMNIQISGPLKYFSVTLASEKPASSPSAETRFAQVKVSGG